MKRKGTNRSSYGQKKAPYQYSSALLDWRRAAMHPTADDGELAILRAAHDRAVRRGA